MKKLFLALLVFIFAICLSFTARADGNLFTSLSLMKTPGGTNSAVLQTNSTPVSVGKITITYSDLSITNAFNGYLKFSLDKTNFVKIGPVYRPAGTNTTTETIQPQSVTVPVYFVVGAETNSWNTGDVSIGGNYTSP